jgi:exonuclease III
MYQKKLSTPVINVNNAINKYGTASLVSSELEICNLKFDTEGRIIVFDIGNTTFANVYFPCGNNPDMRSKRENYAAEILPQLLINSKDTGVVGGDWNCIISDADATKNAGQRASKSLSRLVKTF